MPMQASVVGEVAARVLREANPSMLNRDFKEIISAFNAEGVE